MPCSPRVDVNTFLDNRPMGARQWLVVVLGFIVLAFDGFDTTSIGFVAPALIDDWGITRQALQVRITRGQQPAVRAGDGTPVPGAWLIRKSDVVHHAA